jgi:hypothetical protein
LQRHRSILHPRRRRRESPKEADEIDSGTFVIVTDEDLQRNELDPSTVIEIPHFLPDARMGISTTIGGIYRSDGDARSYFALADALARKEHDGLARWLMRKKEYVGALRSRDSPANSPANQRGISDAADPSRDCRTTKLDVPRDVPDCEVRFPSNGRFRQDDGRRRRATSTYRRITSITRWR